MDNAQIADELTYGLREKARLEAALKAKLDDIGGSGSVAIRPGWVDVKDFGAIGNGVQNDTAAFAAAYSALPVHPYGVNGLVSGLPLRYGTIKVPHGTYIITGTILVSAMTRIVGEGSGATIIFLPTGTWTNPTEEHFMVYYENGVGVTINNHFGGGLEDIRLAGGTNAGASGVYLEAAQGTLLRNVMILDCGLRGAFGAFEFDQLWIASGNNNRGPGLWLRGHSSQIAGGGHASVEHINPSVTVDPLTTEPYPAIRLDTLNGACFARLQTERAGSTTGGVAVELRDCRIVNIGSVYHGQTAGHDATIVRMHNCRGCSVGGIYTTNGTTSGGQRSVYDTAPIFAEAAFTSTVIERGYLQKTPTLRVP